MRINKESFKLTYGIIPTIGTNISDIHVYLFEMRYM